MIATRSSLGVRVACNVQKKSVATKFSLKNSSRAVVVFSAEGGAGKMRDATPTSADISEIDEDIKGVQRPDVVELNLHKTKPGSTENPLSGETTSSDPFYQQAGDSVDGEAPQFRGPSAQGIESRPPTSQVSSVTRTRPASSEIDPRLLSSDPEPEPEPEEAQRVGPESNVDTDVPPPSGGPDASSTSSSPGPRKGRASVGGEPDSGAVARRAPAVHKAAFREGAEDVSERDEEIRGVQRYDEVELQLNRKGVENPLLADTSSGDARYGLLDSQDGETPVYDPRPVALQELTSLGSSKSGSWGSLEAEGGPTLGLHEPHEESQSKEGRMTEARGGMAAPEAPEATKGELRGGEEEAQAQEGQAREDDSGRKGGIDPADAFGTDVLPTD